MVGSVAQVKVHLPQALARQFGLKGTVPAEGANLEAALTGLDRKAPGLSAAVLDDQGRVRKNVIVIINRDTVTHLDPLAVRLRDGDEVHVLPHVAGG
jgi:molybdopterin converting factor small subunit